MNTEKIEENWNRYKKLVEALEKSHPGVESFIEQYAERLAMCPASSETQYFGAYPGGFLELALGVTAKMRALHKVFECDVPMDSVVFVGLLHSIGLMGSEREDLLIPHDSDWHIKKGIVYKHNEFLPKMPLSHRSLYLIQSAGVKMSLDEWTAIATSTGTHRDESKFYNGSEPSLSLLVIQARQWILSRAE
jgi:hypothetical protein